MEWYSVILCGFAGGGIVEGIELWTRVAQSHGQWPIAYTRLPTYVAGLIRISIGGFLAWMLWDSGQIAGSVGAVVAGAAAPFIVGNLVKIGGKIDGDQD
jgi:hypothetical protein